MPAGRHSPRYKFTKRNDWGLDNSESRSKIPEIQTKTALARVRLETFRNYDFKVDLSFPKP